MPFAPTLSNRHGAPIYWSPDPGPARRLSPTRG